MGDTCTFGCVDGYIIDKGSSSRTCRENGEWDGAEPRCSGNLNIILPVHAEKVRIRLHDKGNPVSVVSCMFLQPVHLTRTSLPREAACHAQQIPALNSRRGT